MNQRIEELVMQAMTEEKTLANTPANLISLMERFAELLVRESMEVTKSYTSNQGLDYSAPVALARHFGVNG